MANRVRNNRITLAGVKLRPRIGTVPEERMAPQECEGDLSIWIDLEPAAATDSLDRSIDYCQVLAVMQGTAAACEYNLLETLAYKIARNVLRGFPVDRVALKLRKRPASLLGQIDFVEVDVEEP
jgi:dihydroneopterin aldolase